MVATVGTNRTGRFRAVAERAVLGQIQDRLKPRAQRTAQRLVDPVYARRQELVDAVADIRRLLADQMTADEEATAVFGRVLADLTAQIEALRAEVAALRDEDGAVGDASGGRRRKR